MTLSRQLLLRLRRRMRRRYLNMNTTDRNALRAIEEWTGHRPTTPTNTMKIVRFLGLLLMALVASVFALAFTGCAAPASWEGTPNPLDTPETNIVRPSAMGRFGPHSEFYSTTP